MTRKELIEWAVDFIARQCRFDPFDTKEEAQKAADCLSVLSGKYFKVIETKPDKELCVSEEAGYVYWVIQRFNRRHSDMVAFNPTEVHAFKCGEDKIFLRIEHGKLLHRWQLVVNGKRSKIFGDYEGILVHHGYGLVSDYFDGSGLPIWTPFKAVECEKLGETIKESGSTEDKGDDDDDNLG